MKTILITGGAGFIGSHLIKKLINQNNILVLDNYDSYYDINLKKTNIKQFVNNPNFQFIQGDLRNATFIEDFTTKYKPNSIIHLAAKVGVRNSIQNPSEYFSVNILGTLNLLNSIKKLNIHNFIFASSSPVYGNNAPPFSENDSTDMQLSPYALSKKCAESLCKQYSYLYKIPITCLRFFTVYGPGMRPDLAISVFLNNIIHGSPIYIYGNGRAKRDCIFIDDIVSGILTSLKKRVLFDIINLGSSKSTSINTLISHIEKYLSKKAKKYYKPINTFELKNTQANIIKAQKLLNWKPHVNMVDGLINTITSFT